MSQVAGSRSAGEILVPKQVERLWLFGKYVILGTLALASLTVLTPLLFFLLLFTISLCFPVGCGIATFLYIKKRNNNLSRRQTLPSDDCDWVKPCSSSPSPGPGALSGVTSRSHGDTFLQAKNHASSSVEETEGKLDGAVGAGQNQSTGLEAPDGTSAEPGENVDGNAVTSTEVQVCRPQEAECASTQHGAVRRPGDHPPDRASAGTDSVERDEISAAPSGHAAAVEPANDSKGAVNSSSDNGQGGQSVVRPGGGSDAGVVSFSSDRPLDSTAAAEQRTSEHGHAPGGRGSHHHVHYAKDDSTRSGKRHSKSRRRMFKS